MFWRHLKNWTLFHTEKRYYILRFLHCSNTVVSILCRIFYSLSFISMRIIKEKRHVYLTFSTNDLFFCGAGRLYFGILFTALLQLRLYFQDILFSPLSGFLFVYSFFPILIINVKYILHNSLNFTIPLIQKIIVYFLSFKHKQNF